MPKTLFLLPFMLSLFTIKAAASTLTTSRHYCSNSSTFTPNSTYHTNLNRVLHNLVSDAYGDKGFFFTSSEGSSSEAVRGSFMCKDDVSKKECNECVKNTSLEITRVCHMTKVSVLWYHQCMLCYSDVNSSLTMEMKTWLDGYNEENIEKLDEFMKLLNKTMMVRAASKAAQHPPRKYGHQNAKFTPEKKHRFWSSSKGKVHLPMIIFAAILAATIGLTLLFYKIVWHLLRGRRRRRVLRRNSESRIEEDSIVRRQISELQFLQFHLQTIEAATNNFSDDNKLGEGGFGPVYKGTLPGGQEIAAKRLSRSSGQGVAEFKTEVELVAKLQHRNLVKLLGFSMERDETILVYENMPNRSLDRLLFDPELSGQLDWSARYKVILGVARGLLYLHEDSRLRIIHRDLKASNILLDADMNPKISDFGMARIFGTDQTQASTNIIVGTYGYMSPEYLMFGHFSVKSDVFSYGVLMLEIITGKKNNQFFALDSDEGLLGYIWKHWTNRTLSEVVEPALSSAYPMNEVIRCMHIGLLCVQDNMEDRPTMDAVILMLNGESISIPVPQRPSFFVPSRKYKLAPCVLNSDQSTSKVDHSNSKITPSWFASDSGSVDPGPRSQDFEAIV